MAWSPLTFDDGPGTTTTEIANLLHRRHIPATFFVVGRQVRATPRIVRRISGLGFTVGNHTFRHEWLTALSDKGVLTTLRRTRRAIRHSGAEAAPLLRPPYGSIDTRVKNLAEQLGLATVLWTVDPQNWRGHSADAIAASTLSQLEPDGTNIVIMHDGLSTSTNTLRALPLVIRSARARGYCFAELGPHGRPVPPRPRASVSSTDTREKQDGSDVTATIRLALPTSRATSVRVRTVERTATSGLDYRAVDRRVRFAVGARSRVVRIHVRDDERDERVEALVVRLSRPHGLRLGNRRDATRIRDDDPPPRVSVPDRTMTEPADGEKKITLILRLSRPSGRWIGMTVTALAGTAGEDDVDLVSRTLRLAPGVTRAAFTIAVRADSADEQAESFEVAVVGGRHVDFRGATGTVTILDAD